MIGTTLSHFKITAKLGEGGMGEVYRATDTKLRRDVALKILPEEMASDPERLERFQREATMLAALDHPSIVGVFSVEESDGVHFLTMQLVEGDSLDRLIPEGGLPIEQTFEIAVAIVEALAAAHDKGIIHRDLKPGNIMVTPDRRIKVLDFGLAKITGSQEGAALDSALPTALRTSEGVVMGTVPYMSPEQVEGRMVDHRSDIFSLGVILYEMATGSRPFGGASQAALVSSILRDPPPALSDLRSDLPEELGRLILRCLEKVPERRPQTAAETHAALTAMPSLEVSGSVPTRQSGPRDEGPSIVVLPFANLSPDPDNEYFADGLTEEIIADLSKVGALRVISRTSAMQLKGAKKDVRTIGRDLGVRYVLEGGVRKAGNSLRITAQLIDAESDAHLWSEKYSGTMDDIFEVQERVSREIVGVLDVTLTSDENRRLAERPIANVRAFELYLQARQEIRRIEGNALDRAARLLSQAVEIEGETPPLLALMAFAKVAQVKAGVNPDLRQLDEAEAQALALLERTPDLPQAHALLGSIGYERGRLPQAVWHCKRALEGTSNDADALLYLGASYMAAGQTEEAVETGRRMVALDPLASISWMVLGAAYWFVGRPDDSLPELERSLELDPQNFFLHWTTGYTYATLGRLAEAGRHADFCHEAGPDTPYTRQLLSLIDALEGRQKAALERLTDIDLTPLDAHNKFHLAEPFAMAGDTRRALEILELAVDQGFYPYPFINEYCPFMAPLRSLPEFADILAKSKKRTEAFREEGPIRPSSREAPGGTS